MPTGTTSCARQLDQAGHRHCSADAAQARQLLRARTDWRGPARAGPIERTLFIPDWLQVLNCRRAHAGLNSVRRATAGRGGVLQPPGEIRIGAEQQRYRASGLNCGRRLSCCGTRCIPERATRVGRGRQAGGRRAAAIPVAAGWEHINLNWRYVWRQSRRLEDGKFLAPYGCPENLSVRFFSGILRPLSHLRKAEREDGRPRPRPRAPGARGSARTRATAHERRRSRSARRPPERPSAGREAWTQGRV